MLNIVLFGAPGAGKGTQAVRLAAKYNVPNISTGDIFRTNIKKETELGKIAKLYIDQGLLVPDELVCDLVIDYISQSKCKNGYILDGFPRTIPQAQKLDEILTKDGNSLDCAVNIEVPDQQIVKRMGGRRACTNCGKTYHLKNMPPLKEGICDLCDGALELRDDDKEATVLKRLSVYHQQTQPLIDYYQKVAILKIIDGTQSMDKVFDTITAILGE